ncbi:hypothetical protein MMC12_001382 [Toensbergia leucococca]|nr:hypothetical protein [Toensbergia leucococca]
MLRQTLSQGTKSIFRNTIATRSLSSTAVRMAGDEGATGGIRSGGAAQGDAFSKREKAGEDMYVREQEMQKLRTLKKNIEDQKKHLEELDKNVDAQLGKSGKK